MDMSSILPSTSYIKLMDVWMLASLSFVFVEVILFVLISRAEKHADLAKQEHIIALSLLYYWL